MARRLNTSDSLDLDDARVLDDTADQSIAVVEPNPEVRSFAEEDDHPSTKFPIAGIVGSAGGLDVFKKFFADMPNQSGMAFVLIPHLDTKRKSSMVSGRRSVRIA